VKEQQQAHDCTACYKAVGRWGGVLKMETPEELKDVFGALLVEIIICPGCYNLALTELMARVWHVAKTRAAEMTAEMAAH
jgi:hypothetical protein